MPMLWLPDWKTYADTTAGTVPFGMLPIADTGKPVVHLVDKGPAQHRTPVVPADTASSTYKVHAVQGADGRFEVQVVTLVRGALADAPEAERTVLINQKPVDVTQGTPLTLGQLGYVLAKMYADPIFSLWRFGSDDGFSPAY